MPDDLDRIPVALVPRCNRHRPILAAPHKQQLDDARQEGVSDGKLEVYSPNSPLGSALLDAKVGETRTYTVPNGNTVKVTLVSAEPYHS